MTIKDLLERDGYPFGSDGWKSFFHINKEIPDDILVEYDILPFSVIADGAYVLHTTGTWPITIASTPSQTGGHSWPVVKKRYIDYGLEVG